MPNIIVTPGVVDPTLSQYLTAAQYNAIIAAQGTCRSNACCCACAVEWGVCIITGIWCIFCCHQCIEDSMMQSEIGK